MSLVKHIGIRTGDQPFDIELRAEASNLFNRTLFGGINTNLTDPNFGRPTAVQIGPAVHPDGDQGQLLTG